MGQTMLTPGLIKLPSGLLQSVGIDKVHTFMWDLRSHRQGPGLWRHRTLCWAKYMVGNGEEETEKMGWGKGEAGDFTKTLRNLLTAVENSTFIITCLVQGIKIALS